MASISSGILNCENRSSLRIPLSKWHLNNFFHNLTLHSNNIVNMMFSIVLGSPIYYKFIVDLFSLISFSALIPPYFFGFFTTQLYSEKKVI